MIIRSRFRALVFKVGSTSTTYLFRLEPYTQLMFWKVALDLFQIWNKFGVCIDVVLGMIIYIYIIYFSHSVHPMCIK